MVIINIINITIIIVIGIIPLIITTTTTNLKKPLGIFLVLHFPAEKLGSSTEKVSARTVSETPPYNWKILGV